MKRILRRMIYTAAMLALAGMATVPAASQSGGTYELLSSSVAGGGSTASGGVYDVRATLGQPQANVQSGGEYDLGGGFWGGGEAMAPANDQRNYLPLIQR